MSTVLLVIHLMVAAALVALVLLQRSEGGALGIGGGGGGGFMTGRGTANFLTRTTAYVALAFFLTSVGLTWLARQSVPTSVFDTPGTTQQQRGPGGILPRPQQPQQTPQQQAPAGPQVPQSR